MYAESCTMRITGSVSFIHNKAGSGRGMWLDNIAQLVLESPVSVQFYNRKVWWSNIHISLRLCVQRSMSNKIHIAQN